MERTQIGYDEARAAIESGKAVPHELWILVGDEHARDGYALKPSPWEGPGEYQHIEFEGGSRLIYLPLDAPSLCQLYKRTLKPSRIVMDRQGFTRINGVLLSPHVDEGGKHLRGSLWQGSPDAVERADKMLPIAIVQPPLDNVRGRAGWTVRVEFADAEAFLAESAR
jgi:hypothetical protein